MTHYDILGCDPSSSLDELKAAYHKLALRHHPDKNPSPDLSPSSDQSLDVSFTQIDEAWKILRDPETRKTYDSEIQQAKIEDQSLLFGSYNLAELNFDSQSELYSCDCRCGGSYNFTKKDFEEFNSYLVGCDECSLVISVDLQS